MRRVTVPSCVVLLLTLASCAPSPPAPADPHSFARPGEVVVDHLDLDLAVDFERRTLTGKASLHVINRTGAKRLWLDVREMEIRGVTLGREGTPTTWELGREQPFLGRPLAVEVRPDTEIVHVEYTTHPEAAALQWLEPRMTAGGRQPFLLTQSQSVFARSWVPCQDTPGVRMTYDATVRVPPGAWALMSAENPQRPAPDGVYSFHMPQRIPSYLLALAVGDIAFRPLGPRSGVYADPGVVDAAAWEFADTAAMMAAAERLYGPYRWGRYDVIVLPASFPYGGMENPRLTFATPTILAGDRSLISLVAHELAHSWSGNLVTNASWNDFWLNEGFTVYLEARILEELYGRDYAEMQSLLEFRGMLEEIEDLGADNPLTRLALDLAGRDPEDTFDTVVYPKGYLFLRLLEEAVGREAWDAYLRGYFDRFAFQSMTTERFLDDLRRGLLDARPGLERELRIDEWVHGSGLPDNHPRIESAALAAVDAKVEAWLAGTPAAELDTRAWTTAELLHFLRSLPEPLPAERMAELDDAFGLTTTGNSELLHAWLLHAVAGGYRPADPALERFLIGQGRLKFLRPLYRKLAETESGRRRAIEIYARARPGYHPMSYREIDEVLGRPGAR